jgi:hypothetical protein
MYQINLLSTSICIFFLILTFISMFPLSKKLSFHSLDNNRLINFSILQHNNAVQTLTIIASKHALTYPPSTTRHYKWLSFLQISPPKSLCKPLVSHTYYMHDSLQPSSFGRFYIRHSSAAYIKSNPTEWSWRHTKQQLWLCLERRIQHKNGSFYCNFGNLCQLLCHKFLQGQLQAHNHDGFSNDILTYPE